MKPSQLRDFREKEREREKKYPIWFDQNRKSVAVIIK
jgi:hypothetical protein